MYPDGHWSSDACASVRPVKHLSDAEQLLVPAEGRGGEHECCRLTGAHSPPHDYLPFCVARLYAGKETTALIACLIRTDAHFRLARQSRGDKSLSVRFTSTLFLRGSLARISIRLYKRIAAQHEPVGEESSSPKPGFVPHLDRLAAVRRHTHPKDQISIHYCGIAHNWH